MNNSDKFYAKQINRMLLLVLGNQKLEPDEREAIETILDNDLPALARLAAQTVAEAARQLRTERITTVKDIADEGHHLPKRGTYK